MFYKLVATCHCVRAANGFFIRTIEAYYNREATTTMFRSNISLTVAILLVMTTTLPLDTLQFDDTIPHNIPYNFFLINVKGLPKKAVLDSFSVIHRVNFQ